MFDQSWTRLLFPALLAFAVGGCYAPRAGSPIPTFDGAQLYRSHCASCHGQAGAGDGPMAAQLRAAPTDLRGLSERNGGDFPRFAVSRLIDGRTVIAPHGSRDMPVWGARFRRADNDDHDPVKMAEARIDALVQHIASLQR